MAELIQTKEVFGFVFEAVRHAQQIREGGVQAHEITDGLAPGPFKDALDAAIDKIDQVGPELRTVASGDWRAGSDLLGYLNEEIRKMGDS